MRAPLGNQLDDRVVVGRCESDRHTVDRTLEHGCVDRGANGSANGAMGSLIAGAGPVGRSARIS
jgi:hypothetical protein